MILAEVVDELTYRNYAFNRQNSPDIQPERWAAIYPDADNMEKRYQQEVK